MDSKFLLEIQYQMYEAFVSQDSDLLDVVFEIEGKKLYADKLRLSLISSTFKSMLSEQWNPKNEAIAITCCSFDNFKEFLMFIYTGTCNLNRQNIFAMLDLAEFHQIKQLKKLCDEFFAKMSIAVEDTIHLLETSNKYSLSHLKDALNDFIYNNFNDFISRNALLTADKSVIEELLLLKLNLTKSDKIFPKVYKWIEHEVNKKQQELNNNENFNKNDAVRAELTSFAKFIPFKKDKLDFLNNYKNAKNLHFSDNELNEILENAKTDPLIKVKVTNNKKQTLVGTLPYDSSAIKVIESLKYHPSRGESLIFWNTDCKIPSIPSPIKRSFSQNRVPLFNSIFLK